MNDELTSLYKLRDRIAKDFEAATRSLPEKKALDHAVSLIAILEAQRSSTEGDSAKVIDMPTKKPRTLAGADDKKAMLAWLDHYYSKTNNRPAGFRQLTDLMLADGIKIPGPPNKQVFVVAGLVTRNKKFKGKNRLWHLAEFAA
jgi:hypothetical protein